jgi:aspartyl-tRNA synthetase
MEWYGSDKPDTRFDLKFSTINELVKDCGFRVFSEEVKKGGVVAGFVVPGGASFSRSQMDNLVDFTKSLGGGGLAYFKWTEKGLETSLEKFLVKELVQKIADAMQANQGDLIVFVSGAWAKAYSILGTLRLEVASTESHR